MKSKNFKLSSVIGLFLLIIFASCDDTNKTRTSSNTNTKELSGLISFEKALELETIYKKTRFDTLNSILGYTDTREVWFSIREIKEYIKYTEKFAEEKKYKNLGLRFYFGAYPATKDEKSYSTIFIVPTATNISNIIKPNHLVQANDHDISENMPGIKAYNFGGLGHPPKEYSTAFLTK